MTIIGTCHFKMLRDAVRYYRVYGYNKRDVEEKVKAGDIKLGPPTLLPGERYRLDMENRYILIRP